MAAEELEEKVEIRISVDGEKRYVVDERCSDSCSSSSAVETFSGKDSECEVEGLVKIELDAARALADFAQLALLESENPKGEIGRKWGNKRKRSRKRVKEESSVCEWSKSLQKCKIQRTKVKPKCSDLVQDSSIADQRRQNKVCQSVITKTVKAELDSDSPGPICSTGCVSYGGGKPKKILTEAEKEARRIRRILANRESARQTIRRRQALCEELTRKASDLAWDNENMKREKELVTKDYQSLKDTNNQLKIQIAKTSKAKDETREETPSPPSLKLPLLVYNRPTFTHFSWPSMMQPLNAVQTNLGPPNGITSKDPISTTSNSNSLHEQGNPQSVNGLVPPFYIVPYPWFFPLPDQHNGFHSQSLESCNLKHNQDDNSADIEYNNGSSSKDVKNVQNHHPSLSKKGKRNASSSEEINCVKNISETSYVNLGGHIVLMPSHLGSVNVKCENGHEPDFAFKEENVPSEVNCDGKSFPEMTKLPNIEKSSKLIDANAAAVARKRRKAITMLKNLRNKQFFDAAEAATEARKRRKEVTKLKNLYNRVQNHF